MVGRSIVEHPSSKHFEVFAPSRAELDLQDFEHLTEVLGEYQPDLVIHCAGRVGGIAANIADPMAFLVENLDVGRNVILAAHRSGVRRLLNLSSSCVYPRNHNTPLAEDMILSGWLEPTNEGYALAKIVAMKLCEYITRQNSSFLYKSIIPCNVFGRNDKFDLTTAHLVPAIIAKIANAKRLSIESIDVWGDGSARREFMYADDLAEFVWIAASQFEMLPHTMNVGAGVDYTINEYYHMTAEILNWNGQFVHDLSKPSGMQRKLLDVTLQRRFGWSPPTSLAEGIKLTAAYFLGVSSF